MLDLTRWRVRVATRALVLLLPLFVALGSTLVELRQDKTAPFPRRGHYVDENTCKDCHEDERNAIRGGVHAAVLDAKELHACETCHGPGEAHAKHQDNDPALITHPHKLGAATVAFCGRCHTDASKHHGGDLAGFLAAGKTCTTCHKVHSKTPSAAPRAGVAFVSRRDLAAHPEAKPVGAGKCLECHPLRDRLLQQSHHAHLASTDDKGCETCHGPGSLHVETGGLARLIARPDTAGDGVATCRSCHEHVDPVDFHWKGKRKPLLSAGLTCTSCHTVHAAKPDVGAASGHASGPSQPLAAAPHASVHTLPDAGALASAASTARQPTATNALCAKCHAPVIDVPHGTIHTALGGRDTPLAQGCGGCHQGGEAHARSGGKKQFIDALRGSSAAHQRDTCLSCHKGESTLTHHAAGSHYRNDVGCLSCHSPSADKHAVRRDAESRCADCHQKVAAEFRMPNHHPVPEHAMGCSDCHDPHGARSKQRDLELRQDRCVRCHTQYRGPFVFAHQAGRSDGCVVCHTPHGSTNKRLLLQHTTQQNCLQCHGDFPIFHDQTQGAVFTNCLNCHTEVHGSNHSRYLFR